MKARYALSALLLLLVFCGCDDDTAGVGLGMFPSGDKNIKGRLTTFDVTTRSVPAGRIYAKTNLGYVGRFTDELFGTYEAGFLASVNCPDNLTFPGAYQQNALDENGKAFRLPISSDFIRENPFGVPRIVREVSTERDLMNCGGIFYELPAKNAGGLSKARALARCPYAVFDYCSFRGMMIISGISKDAPMRKNPHIIISEDGEFALWAGAIDDVWKLGKPQAKGSPWFEEPVVKDQISEPIIMSGFDKKRIEIKSSNPVKIAVEIDVDGTGLWVEDRIVEVEPDKAFTMDMRRGNIAYWLRFRAMGESGSITATLICE